MKAEYRELVGLQVTFQNDVARYNLTNYYRWKRVAVVEPVMAMQSFDLERSEDTSVIIASLRKAYGPAELSVWTSKSVLADALYMQFEVGARPDELDLDGDWTIVP